MRLNLVWDKLPERLKKIRGQEGFSLPTIICLGVCAGLVLISTAQLLNVTSTKVAGERLTDTLRASAEGGLDWAVQQMSDANLRAAVDTGGAVDIPVEYLANENFTGTVTVANSAAPVTSYLYSTGSDGTINGATTGNQWRVITATVTNGVRNKSVRVIVKPVYVFQQNVVYSTSTSNVTTTSTSTSTSQVNGTPIPYFAKSLFGRGVVTFNGNNASTNSYDSGGTVSNPSSFDNFQGDLGTNASADIGNGNIGGNVTTSSGDTTGTVDTGPQAHVYGHVEASGAISGSGTIDESGSNLSNTSAAQVYFPDAPTAPSGATTISGGITGDHTISTAGNYIVNQISLTGNKALTVSTTGIVNIYVQGNPGTINIAGNGIASNGVPGNVRIWYNGTSPVSIGGNGSIKAVLYAPHAPLDFHGNGAFYGAAVGTQVTVSGNGAFHYDRNLGQNQQLYYTPLVTQVNVVTNTQTGTVTTTTSSVNTIVNIDHFQAVSWMEF